MPFKIFPTAEEVRYPKVDTHADLPDASDHTGEIYVVLTATGIWGVNRKRSGMWSSDGVSWNRLGVAPTAEQLGAIVTSPPSGKCKVTNLFVDPSTGKLAVEYEDTPIE